MREKVVEVVRVEWLKEEKKRGDYIREVKENWVEVMGREVKGWMRNRVN